MTEARSKQVAKVAWAVFALALALRLGAAWLARDAKPVFDERLYPARAEALLDGEGFVGSYQSWVRHPGLPLAEAPQYLGAWQPPGYTVFLAGVFAVAGRSLLAARMFQASLGAAVVALLAAMAARLAGKERALQAAWCTGLLAACYPNLIAFSHLFWSETLFIALLMGGLACLWNCDEMPGVKRSVMAGLFLGAATLTRGSLLWLLPFIGLWIYWTHRPRGSKAWRPAMQCMLGAVLVLAPWIIRNTGLHGSLVLVDTNGAYNLWRGSDPNFLTHRDKPGERHYPVPFESLPVFPAGNRAVAGLVREAAISGLREPTDVELVAFAAARAREEIAADPGAALARGWTKVIDMWNPTSFLTRHLELEAYGQLGGGWRKFLEWSSYLSYLTVLGLGLLGLVRNLRDPRAQLVLFLALALTLFSALAFGLTRFRLPLMPLLLIFAGQVLAKRAKPSASALAAPSATLAIFVAVSACVRAWGLRLLGGLSVVLLLSACGGGEPPQPNIVLLTLDTTRSDHLASYGYFRETTPELDAFAAESILFERCITPMATTLPTHTSILTGTFPLEHGVLANSTQGGKRFSPSNRLQSFAALAQGAGYQTAAFVSATPLKSDSGIAAGFTTFDEPEGKQRQATETADGALAWLAEVGADEPYFLWVHFYDPHYPFIAPEPYASRFVGDERILEWMEEREIEAENYRPLSGRTENAREVLDGYDAELLYMDSELKRIFEALKARTDWDRTSVVIAGDHGEGLGQHGEPAHGNTWQEQLGAPLIIRAPGVAPRRVPHTVSTVDALPTLLTMIDAPAFEAFTQQVSGRNALLPEARYILSQDTGRDRGDDPFKYSLTGARYKYFRIEYPNGDVGESLYDLSQDPHELNDLAPSAPPELATLRAVMNEQLAKQRKRGIEIQGESGLSSVDASDEVLDELEDLGYLGKE